MSGSADIEIRSSSIPQAWARRALFAILDRLEEGRITIEEPTASYRFGTSASPSATIIIRDPAAYPRLLFGGTIGAGETYVEGLWDSDDLTSLIRILLRNRRMLARFEKHPLAWLLRPMSIITHLRRFNSRRGSKQNIISHYDLGNELYQSFLDPTMTYSSAIYPDAETTLDEAAIFKLDHICRRLGLTPGDRVIEIGGGWGGFAIHAATHYGCHVTTTTISDAQYKEAKRRIEAAGLTDKIKLIQQDYRDLSGHYDKLVSIEMIEAVGYSYLPGFFKKCCSLLKKDGQILIQAITMRDQYYQSYLRHVDFIQKHIFPGGCLVSNSHMLELLREKTDMVVHGLEDFGLDYARTLAHWRTRFTRAFPRLRQHGFDERFRRLWEFYLSYCEGGFRERSISVVQLVAARPGYQGASWQQ
jgi:cyclopropane-fatty-acyl-phospholipid synthase